MIFHQPEGTAPRDGLNIAFSWCKGFPWFSVVLQTRTRKTRVRVRTIRSPYLLYSSEVKEGMQ